MDPLRQFQKWYDEELKLSDDVIPSACCLSTIGLDGFPNARFVSLKEIHEHSFLITGSKTSLKGREIAANDKVAFTFWWTKTQRQVRVQGKAAFVGEEFANRYFEERSREAKLASLIFKQGEKAGSISELENLYKKKVQELAGQEISPPENWGAYKVEPFRMEFMQFKENRFHIRELYSKLDNEWEKQVIQP